MRLTRSILCLAAVCFAGTFLPASAETGSEEKTGISQQGYQHRKMGTEGEQSAQQKNQKNQQMSQQQQQEAGVSSATLRQVQQELNEQINADLNVDGVFGEDTKEAIKRFQAQNDLPETGRPDSATLAELDVEGQQ